MISFSAVTGFVQRIWLAWWKTLTFSQGLPPVIPEPPPDCLAKMKEMWPSDPRLYVPVDAFAPSHVELKGTLPFAVDNVEIPNIKLLALFRQRDQAENGLYQATVVRVYRNEEWVATEYELWRDHETEKNLQALKLFRVLRGNLYAVTQWCLTAPGIAIQIMTQLSDNTQLLKQDNRSSHKPP